MSLGHDVEDSFAQRRESLAYYCVQRHANRKSVGSFNHETLGVKHRILPECEVSLSEQLRNKTIVHSFFAPRSMIEGVLGNASVLMMKPIYWDERRK